MFRYQVNMKKIFFLLASSLILAFGANSQVVSSKVYSLSWDVDYPYSTDDVNSPKVPYFKNAVYSAEQPRIPSFRISSSHKVKVTVVSESEIPGNPFWSSDITENYEVSYLPNSSTGLITTIRKDQNGRFYRLNSFTIEDLDEGLLVTSATKAYTGKVMANSPLANGNWFKISTDKSNVYKITPDFLSSNGAGSGHSISLITVYGNQVGMLPENTSAPRSLGLQEIPLYVVDENNDGIFNGKDYILFYAKGPHQWEYLSGQQRYNHLLNIYTEKTYYYIGTSVSRSKNIAIAPETSDASTVNSDGFDDFQFHELELTNILGTGRQWMGELYDYKLTYDYDFTFPNIKTNEPVFIRSRVLGRSTTSNTFFQISSNGGVIDQSNIQAVSGFSGADYVRERILSGNFTVNSNSFTVTGKYLNSSNPSAICYMDYLEVTVRRPLDIVESSTIFSDSKTIGVGEVTTFSFSNASNNAMIWDISKPLNTFQTESNVSAGTLTFKVNTDTLRNFVLINSNDLTRPKFEQKVDNQDLLGMSTPDYFIITHQNFIAEAEELAEFHESKGLSTEVVPVQKIFEEFGSGSPDPTAIRDFLMHHYNKGGLKFALMFGDASYDYKSINGINHNFVPTYESDISFSLRTSYASDDYFALLTPNEGIVLQSGFLDIGVGRLTVKSVSEARAVVNKIKHYGTIKESNASYWQNKVLMVADDNDDPTGWESMFVNRMEVLANNSISKYPYLNFEKVYADAYTQVTISGSQRYPEAQKEIFDKVQKGNLVTTYFGHGGEVGWAFERILQLKEINDWSNLDKMPVFVTITCEFSRYDDPTRVSAGEQLLTNSKGGGIALITTTREVSAGVGVNMNDAVFDTIFGEVNYQSMRLGDIVMSAKNSVVGEFDRPRFTLLGDPALRLRKPNQRIVTKSINGSPISSNTDTLKALSKVVIEGEVTDDFGNLLTDFNGVVYPEVYDKEYTRYTLVNDGVGSPIPFKLQDNVLYRGKVSAVGGKFSFEFIVPLDINYSYGNAKLSYYGHGNNYEATGSEFSVIVGGLDTTADADNLGPEISLFMNSDAFVDGGLTGPSPLGLAYVLDSSGVNTLGASIGHDIVGVLDGDVNNLFVLNEYYEAELDSYQKGIIRYPFFDLEPGPHELLVRVWDVYNNPSEAKINFLVADDDKIAIEHVLNYPNPFTTYTEFQFEHNRESQPLDVQIQIFSVAGDLVKTIQTQVTTADNRVTGISWDGLDDYGDKIGKGTYIYKVKIRSQLDGSITEKYEKLVILR